MPANYRRSAQLGLTAIACAVLAACGSISGTTDRLAGLVTPYKIEIVQGNFVSKEQVQALQRGMTRSQVKEVLGTPLLTSVFHADRWDYVFTLKRQGVAPQSRKLTVHFQGEQLDKWVGDEMPSEAEFVAALDSGRKSGKVPLLEVPEDVLKEFNLKNPPAPRAPAPVAAAPSAAYPPLEAPGTTTQAWDAATQRAVVAAAAARPATQALAPAVAARPAAPAPAVVAAAPATAAAVPAPAPSTAARTAPAAPVPNAAPTAAPLPSAPAVSQPVAPVAISPAPPPGVAPAAAAAPAPAAAPTTVGFGGLDPEVAAFLNGWMNDWQARNSSAFFARYVPEFKGTSATRAEWEALRRPRIESRLSVSLAVQDVRGVMMPPGAARVVFRQVYDSDAGSEIGTKALFMVKRDGRWLIEREFFTPAR